MQTIPSSLQRSGLLAIVSIFSLAVGYCFGETTETLSAVYRTGCFPVPTIIVRESQITEREHSTIIDYENENRESLASLMQADLGSMATSRWTSVGSLLCFESPALESTLEFPLSSTGVANVTNIAEFLQLLREGAEETSWTLQTIQLNKNLRVSEDCFALVPRTTTALAIIEELLTITGTLDALGTLFPKRS